MTDALQLYLLRPSDLPMSKPRNAAEAIARKLVEKAQAGDNDSAKLIYDRIEGKAQQYIETKTTHEVVDVVEAARRIAFALNTASARGEVLEGVFAEIAEKARAYEASLLPPVNAEPDKD